MRSITIALATALCVQQSRAVLSAELCGDSASEVYGNWYCKAVSKISYTNVGGASSYKMPNMMDSTTGKCTFEPKAFSGPLAPLNEEVSHHFRGPMHLKKFAVYYPVEKPATSKREVFHDHSHRHNHLSLHRRRKARGGGKKRGVGDMVTAVINGLTQTWVNTYAGPTGDAEPVIEASGDTSSSSCTETSSSVPAATSEAVTKPSPASTVSSNFGSGVWVRSAYYNAAEAKENGLVFLNHMGADGISGTFDMAFGNSLSYASEDATTCASSPQLLADASLGNNVEVAIFTDKKCTGSSCGFVRPKSVAYHGFDGAEKAFVAEFAMPNNSTGSSFNENMPAWWLLNANIPRTQQYGDCSCWQSGCGEFDIFEILDSTTPKAKSTLHGIKNGGDSNYFERPVDKTIQVAVVMANNDIHVQVLDEEFSFGEHWDADTMSSICSVTENSLLQSVFDLA